MLKYAIAEKMRGAVKLSGSAEPYAAKLKTAASVGVANSRTCMPTRGGIACLKRPSSRLRASITCSHCMLVLLVQLARLATKWAIAPAR